MESGTHILEEMAGQDRAIALSLANHRKNRLTASEVGEGRRLSDTLCNIRCTAIASSIRLRAKNIDKAVLIKADEVIGTDVIEIGERHGRGRE